jgi:hypothetical protein
MRRQLAISDLASGARQEQSVNRLFLVISRIGLIGHYLSI